jgi:hypothetical protein
MFYNIRIFLIMHIFADFKIYAVTQGKPIRNDNQPYNNLKHQPSFYMKNVGKLETSILRYKTNSYPQKL